MMRIAVEAFCVYFALIKNDSRPDDVKTPSLLVKSILSLLSGSRE
jgi:hypothetical protein